MEESRTLARFAAKLAYGDLPGNVVQKTKELILDQLGCQLAGSTLPWTRPAYEYVVDGKGGRQESTVIYYGLRTSAQDAAFANASFGHGTMGDDTDSICHAHFGSIIIPAALALGEREGITGRELIKAVVVGYEIASRIGAAAPLAEGRGFHPGPIFGPFGVAACSGVILKFDENQILDAVGIAGSHASGLMEYSRSGGTVNRLHSSIAAYGGMRAAFLTQKGVKGPTTVLEGERGFLRAYSGESILNEMTQGLGERYRVLLNELKAYCCCGTLPATLDAVSKIKAKHDFHPDDVEEIIACVNPLTFGLTGLVKEPEDVTSAQFSGSFGVALRLMKGGNGFREYSEENLRDPSVLALAGKTKIILDEDIGKLPGSDNPARVQIKLTNGKMYEETVAAGRGSILNPMGQEEGYEKFRGFAHAALPGQDMEAVIQKVAGLEYLDDVRELIQMVILKG
jgi:2-methylcitrate dehydratase PrpD